MSKSRQDAICQMFDRISPTYDRTNRVLSWGQDRRWRKQVAERIDSSREIVLLDLACGTADLLIDICQARPNVKKAIGLDLASKMLEVARQKLQKMSLAFPVELLCADASYIPFPDAAFDCITIAFGIRNVVHFEQALKEMYRVLRPGGQVLILEFSLPKNTMLRHLYLFYLRHILPRLGGILSKDQEAYQYLNRTVEAFPYGERFIEVMNQIGFSTKNPMELHGGIATIYIGGKK